VESADKLGVALNSKQDFEARKAVKRSVLQDKKGSQKPQSSKSIRSDSPRQPVLQVRYFRSLALLMRGCILQRYLALLL